MSRCNFFFLIVLFILLGGCASTDTLSGQMAAWQDSDIDTVIAEWGEPDGRESFDDGEVLVWFDHAPLPITHSERPVAPVVVCQRMLAVTADGTITGWRWRGDACPSISSRRLPPGIVASTGTR